MARLRQRRTRVWAVAAALCLAANAALFALPARESSRALDAVASEIAEARTRLESLREERAEAQAAANAEDRRARAATMLRDHPDWSTLLSLLSALRGDDTLIESCEIERVVPATVAKQAKPAEAQPRAEAAERFNVRIAGLARSPSAATSFVLRLERTGLFDQARLVETRPGQLAGGDASYFHIDCSIGELRRSADAGGGP